MDVARVRSDMRQRLQVETSRESGTCSYAGKTETAGGGSERIGDVVRCRSDRDCMWRV